MQVPRPLTPGDENEVAIPADGIELGDGPNGPGVAEVRPLRPLFRDHQSRRREKPKRASVPRGWTAEDVPLDKAIALLSLPREVGMHPSENEMILAGLGRYGPYLQMGKMYASLPSIEDVRDPDEPRRRGDRRKEGRRRQGRFGRAAPADQGTGRKPSDGRGRAFNGRYGPYINDGETNANVPKDKKPGRCDARRSAESAGRTCRQGRRQEKAKRRPRQESGRGRRRSCEAEQSCGEEEPSQEGRAEENREKAAG
ncbi:MAG: topoisomerase C-terminal repeat-containing protein [Hyphomonadaceae bacterium]